ncbi:MAG: hypothetical protein DCC73_11985 [Proteobacteria bacterium]|nr:MAG: hypothetical protein DCC73_11985 [Pseudomonadota bacterium]
MTELAVSVRLKADGSGLVGELRVSKAELDKLAQAAKGAGASAAKAGGDIERAGEKTRKAGQAARQASSGFGELKALLATLGLAAMGRQFLQAADSMTLMRGRLALVVREGESVDAVFNDLFGRAQDARTNFEAFNTTFFRTALALKEHKTLAGSAVEVTTLLSKAARVGGAGMVEMNAGLMQLSQGLSSGELRGEEFRSVMENIPGVARAIAAGLNLPTAALRDLAEQGKLTADVVVNALLRQKDAIERDYATLPRTVGEAWVQFKNELVRIEDEQNRATAATSGLVDSIDSLRGSLTSAAPVIAALAVGLADGATFAANNLDVIVSLTTAYFTYRTAVVGLTAAVNVATKVMAIFNGTLKASPIGLIATGLSLAAGALVYFQTNTDKTTNALLEQIEAQKALKEALDSGAIATEATAKRNLDAAKASLEAALATREETKARLESAKAILEEQHAKLRAAALTSKGLVDQYAGGQTKAQAEVDALQKKLGLADEDIAVTEDNIKRLNTLIKNIGKSGKSGGDDGGITFGLGKSEKDKIISDYEDVAAALDPVLQRQFQLAEATGKLKSAFAAGVIDQGTLDRLKALAETKFAAPDAAKWMDEQAKASREQLRLLGLSTREREIEEETIRRVNDAKKDGVTIEGQNLEIVRQQVAAEYDVAAAAEKRREAQKRAGDEFNKIWENAVENVQRTLADTIDGVLGGKINSVKDFWKAFMNIGRRAIADTLAALVFTGGKIPEGSSLGGLAGVLTSIFGGKKKKQEKEDGDRGAWVKKIEDDLDIAPKDKPKLGAFGVGLKDAFTQAEELLKPLAEGLKKTFKPLFESFGKTFKGVFGRSVGEAFGRAFGGAGVGTMVAGIGKALGINLSTTGSQIGGAIGSFIPIPGGNIIGSIIGGLVGKMFGKTPVARASFSTGAVDPETYKRGKADTGVAVGLVGAARQGLEQIASTLGGSIVEGLDLGGLGTRKKKYVFDPVGQGKKFGKNKSTRYNTAEEATAAAVQYALEHDAIAGLSETASRVLKQFKDVNVGLREATKVVNLERFIDSFTNPFKTAAKEFELQAAERVKVARNYGFDVVEIERLNAKEREKFIAATLEQTTGSVKRLLDDLKLGGRAEGSAVERRAALLAERDQLAAKAQAGDTSALDRLAEISAQLLDASEEAFGSTQAYADDRAATMSLLQSLLTETEARIKAAQDEAKASVAAATNPQLSEANQSLDDIANGVGQLLAEFVRLRQAMTGTTAQGTATPTPAVNADLLARLRASVMRF